MRGQIHRNHLTKLIFAMARPASSSPEVGETMLEIPSPIWNARTAVWRDTSATSANGVAHNIRHILSVTEHTQDGTMQTAQSIRQLTLLAQELKNSVSRFRVTA